MDPARVGNWCAKEVLGSGGFGVVTLWLNQISGKALAIKKCKAFLPTSITQRQRERWASEVKMMQQMNNDNIVRFCDIPHDLERALLKNNPAGLALLSMEYCSMGNLRDVLTKAKHCCGLPEQNVICILKDISNALMYLHDLKITHRDVKPENIVLQTNPDRKLGVIYKLIDLGYAKELNGGTISFVGTLQYLAPEIFKHENYNFTVDYWSLGIMAFEIICGVRPFLPTYTHPVQSFKLLEAKGPDVICIQFSHIGAAIQSTEILAECRINESLKHLLEKWFRVVLQYEPGRRCLLDHSQTNAFQYLQRILWTKCITVFSVSTYAFYCYEVSDSTLFSTLEDWIARDTQFNKEDFYIISSKKCDSVYAADFYDEEHSDAMIFVYKKSSPICNTTCTGIPTLIKLLFTNVKTEFKNGTLKSVYAHSIFFIIQQNKHLTALKKGIILQADFLSKALPDELSRFIEVYNFLSAYLTEIEFYNYLYKKVVKRKTHSKKFQELMSKLKTLINITNILHDRYYTLFRITQRAKEATSVIHNKLDSYDFKKWYTLAKQCYYDLIDNSARTSLVVQPVLLQVLSSTFQIRDTLLRDNELLNYIKSVTKCHKEYLQLVSSRISLQENVYAIKDKLRNVVIEMLCTPAVTGACEMELGCENYSTATLIAENTALRYKLQEFFNSSIVAYKNGVYNVDDGIY